MEVQHESGKNEWTPVGIDVKPGQKLWIDTKSKASKNAGALIGRIGTNGNSFVINNDLLNFAPNQSGALQLKLNASGISQETETVRVVAAQ